MDDVLSNCAMCSMAAVLGTDTNVIEELLHARGQSENALIEAFGYDGLSGAEQHQQVMNSMIGFVRSVFKSMGKTVDGYQFGTWENMKDITASILYMSRKRIGTPFAVWGCMKDPLKGYGSHWNYAIKTENGIRFFDYQDQVSPWAKVEGAPTFIPPKGLRGMADAYNGHIVLSFQDKPQG